MIRAVGIGILLIVALPPSRHLTAGSTIALATSPIATMKRPLRSGKARGDRFPQSPAPSGRVWGYFSIGFPMPVTASGPRQESWSATALHNMRITDRGYSFARSSYVDPPICTLTYAKALPHSAGALPTPTSTANAHRNIGKEASSSVSLPGKGWRIGNEITAETTLLPPFVSVTPTLLFRVIISDCSACTIADSTTPNADGRTVKKSAIDFARLFGWTSILSISPTIANDRSHIILAYATPVARCLLRLPSYYYATVRGAIPKRCRPYLQPTTRCAYFDPLRSMRALRPAP